MPWLACVLAMLPLGLGARDAHGTFDGQRAEAPGTAERMPDAAPGAAPSADRIFGTWTVTEFRGGPANGRGDHSASTTYRFRDGGRVTVAGSRQCAYTLEGAELTVDCAGRITSGTVEFRGETGMTWTIGADRVVVLVKR